MPYFSIDPTLDLGHPTEYFTDREIVIDCRGPLKISPQSHWGVGVHVITASHDPNNFSQVVLRPVTVDAGAWICSYAILYNCHIGKRAVVAVGAVVRSRDVPANTMVEGNPAKIIASFEHGMWSYLKEPIELERKK